MPSKRKKNKRRMRRVQAQRRLLEDQHVASPPVKTSPATAVRAPGTVTKKAAKTPKPAPPKVPEAVPIAPPVEEAPTIIPKVEPPKEEPVSQPALITVVPEPEPVVVLKQTPAGVEMPAPVPVIIETPVIDPPSVETAKVEVAFVREDEDEEEKPIVPVPEPTTEVTLPAETEVPVAAPAEIQVINEEPLAEITETEQTHDVCEPQVEAELATITEEEPTVADEVDDTISVEIQAEPVCTEEPVVEVTIDTVEADVAVLGSLPEEADDDESIDSGPLKAPVDEEPESIEPVEDEPIEVVEVVTQEVEVREILVQCGDFAPREPMEPGPVAEEEEKDEEESCSSEEEEVIELEVLSEEEPAEEAVAQTEEITEDIPVPVVELPMVELPVVELPVVELPVVELPVVELPVVEIPVVQDTLTEPSLAEAPQPVPHIDQVHMDTSDMMEDDFVVTDPSVEVIEPNTTELLPVLEKPTVAVCEIVGPGPAMTIPEPKLVTPAEETLANVDPEKCLDVEEPVSEKCGMPCQIQLSADTVQLTSMEMSVEAALNGHIIPELSIES